ncbi:MAG: hypothetical protein ACE366_03630 [Bradymonadia bacterium]
MRRRIGQVGCAVVAMSVALSSAHAQNDESSPGEPAVKVIDFERGSTVTSTPESPWLEQTVIRLGGRHGSLVQVRTDFKDRMLADADML